jgi:hypothetical protein
MLFSFLYFYSLLYHDPLPNSTDVVLFPLKSCSVCGIFLPLSDWLFAQLVLTYPPGPYFVARKFFSNLDDNSRSMVYSYSSLSSSFLLVSAKFVD